jgi:hypothetical protein
MEFSACPSTTPTQSNQPIAASSFDPNSPDVPQQYYLSPDQERAPQNATYTQREDNNMTTSPNGTAASACDHSRSVSPRTGREPKNLSFELIYNAAL